MQVIFSIYGSTKPKIEVSVWLYQTEMHSTTILPWFIHYTTMYYEFRVKTRLFFRKFSCFLLQDSASCFHKQVKHLTKILQKNLIYFTFCRASKEYSIKCQVTDVFDCECSYNRVLCDRSLFKR